MGDFVVLALLGVAMLRRSGSISSSIWFSLLGAGVQGQTAQTQQQQATKPLLHGMPGCQTADGVHGIVLIEVHAEHATGA